VPCRWYSNSRRRLPSVISVRVGNRRKRACIGFSSMQRTTDAFRGTQIQIANPHRLRRKSGSGLCSHAARDGVASREHRGALDRAAADGDSASARACASASDCCRPDLAESNPFSGDRTPSPPTRIDCDRDGAPGARVCPHPPVLARRAWPPACPHLRTQHPTRPVPVRRSPATARSQGAESSAPAAPGHVPRSSASQPAIPCVGVSSAVCAEWMPSHPTTLPTTLTFPYALAPERTRRMYW